MLHALKTVKVGSLLTSGVWIVFRLSPVCLHFTDDTDLLPDSELVHVEEALEVDEEDGVTLEPFHMQRERAEGHFDEGGAYVEHTRDDAESRDAWLDSGSPRRIRHAVIARPGQIACSSSAQAVRSSCYA